MVNRELNLNIKYKIQAWVLLLFSGSFLVRFPHWPKLQTLIIFPLQFSKKYEVFYFEKFGLASIIISLQNVDLLCSFMIPAAGSSSQTGVIIIILCGVPVHALLPLC